MLETADEDKRGLSRYETLQKEQTSLRLRQVTATYIPAMSIVVTLLAALTRNPGSGTSGLVSGGLAASVVGSLLLHYLWKALIPIYRQWAERSTAIAVEIEELRRRVTTIFDRYRDRRKGEAFKRAYELAGKSVAELEEALAIGMFRENREVFVTAFVRAGLVVRITASIGTPFRCAASDNPAHWAGYVERLRCDELRQYHNHPVHDGQTRPSRIDFRTSRSLRSLLGSHGPKLRSLIICWNPIREWKVFEHDDGKRYWLCSELDAATRSDM